ncbi:N-acetyltransferase [Forsythia ovata]|uniref:N-acetyltransferase n=1 Tax=Forsythia ovata TaxID=205694 RepID=A0ABD1PL46_9LAMI
MARRKASTLPASTPIRIGDFYFLLVNPKDSDAQTKSLIQEVLQIYSKELPAMNYAANTGKESMFLERCISNGKYCTLALNLKGDEDSGKVIAALTYQIIPADTQYAEIPLAAVSSIYQHKGIGHLLYTELRNRLQSVGIHSIFCWGDEESKGFWLKQGFVAIGEVDTKGKARRLPIKADIRRALCYPGGSTLMVTHLSKDSSPNSSEYLRQSIPILPPGEYCPSAIVESQKLRSIEESHDSPNEANRRECSQIRKSVTDRFSMDGCKHADLVPTAGHHSIANGSGLIKSGSEVGLERCSCSELGTKKRLWEASHTSLKSKKVKGAHVIDCRLGSDDSVPGRAGRNDCCFRDNSYSAISRSKISTDVSPNNLLTNSSFEENNDGKACNVTVEGFGAQEVLSSGQSFRIMLMNIADDNKKSNLTKIIEDLGGLVTSDGSVSTHVITGKVRKTLNFCTALCSGAWIISPSWLKESFRKGRFVDEMPFTLKDDEYETKYRTELKCAVLRAKASPRALLKGLDVCLATHVHPPVGTLSTIVKSAGGNVIRRVDEVNEASKTMFIACEEDMEEALSAVRKGIWTFSSEWLMNCIMRQELDLEAPQFAESL